MMISKKSISLKSIYFFLVVSLIIVFPLTAEVFSPEDALRMKSCGNAEISPDGKWIAYTVSVPREAGDEPGGSYRELYVVSTETGKIRPFVTGKVNVSSPRWDPDGTKIGFTARRGAVKTTQVWAIPMSGGEAVQITHSPSSVSYFQWHPDGKRIGYIATTPKSKGEKSLEKKGYDFVYFEENLKHRNLYLACTCGGEGGKCQAQQLSEGVTVWDFVFSPDGKTVAASVSPKNLIDQRYMFRKVYLIDVETKERRQLTSNEGKLGNYAFSPDGSKLAYAAARELKDHAVSQAYVIDIAGGEATNLTPPDFRGHVNWVGWKDSKTVAYRAGEGVWPTLNTVSVNSGERKVVLNSADSGIIFSNPSFTSNFKNFAFIGDTPKDSDNVYFWRAGKELKKLTDVNPWFAEREFAEQEVIRYDARDGQEIEGILIYPVDYTEGKRYPMVLMIHGGPESHHSNGWMTSYSRPAQVLAGKGYAVLFLNYRASTGYGVDFGLAGYEDPAGVEFDDIADAIKHFIDIGLADEGRIGLGGGSYGGYAAAWFSSYYTDLVKAVCMFVGISNNISRRGTCDIPYEELYVHSGQKLEKMWDISLKRSPIYWAHQSKTAVLILGGTDDTRVHPSQSLEYYRRLKMNDHPAVRLVQYPGEGHGNRKQPGRIDFIHRTIDWYDWYVMDDKPLNGPLPPMDISDKYGLDLE